MPNDRFDSTTRRLLRGLALAAYASSLAACVHDGTTVATAPPAVSHVRTALALPTVHRRVTVHAKHQPLFRPHQTTAKSFDGVASYYWEGTRVATGARYNPEALTAAHRDLPLGTRLRVSDPKTGRSVVVIINDRGPYIPGRVLDLSVGAARALGLQERGIGRVHGEVLSPGRTAGPL